MKRRLAFAALYAVIATTAQAADADLARNLAATCANCHGTNGRSAGGIESLAGEPKEDLLKKLEEFRSGTRAATIMHQISKGYTAEQLELIAGFYAAQNK